MEVIYSSWSQGLGYHRPVIEKDNRAQGGKKMSVAVVREETRIPIFAQFWGTLLHGVMEVLVLGTGVAGGLQHLPGNGL